MNTRERILSVYRNQMPDRLPVGIYERFLKRGRFERECRELGLGMLGITPLASLLAPTWHVLDGYISEVKNARFNVAYDWQTGHRRVSHVYDTPAGSISRISAIHPETGSEWVTKHYIESPEDYDAVQYLVENTVFESRHGEFRQSVREMDGDGVVFARIDRSGYQKLIIELANPQQAMTDLLLNPEKPERLIAAINQRLEEQFERVLDSDAEIIWQPENLSADMTPPDLFRKYGLPLYQKFAQRCREAGKIYIVHMDGRLLALKDLIAQAPISVVESYSLPEMANDLSVADARKAWRDTVLSPNFPAALCDSGEAPIAARIDALIEEMGPKTPFMLSVSEDLPREAYAKVLPALSRYFSG